MPTNRIIVRTREPPGLKAALWYGRGRPDFPSKLAELDVLLRYVPPLARPLQFRAFTSEPLLIAHFQGMSVIHHWPAVAAFQDARISVPDNITVVTFASANVVRSALLTRQLNRSHIPYINAARHIACDEDWDNPLKSALLVKALPRVTTEYTLVLDALDVLLCGPLDLLVERFHRYHKRVVFGATKRPWPPMDLSTSDEGHPSYGEYSFLNAGTAFGQTEDVLAFYREAMALTETVTTRSDYRPHSEQYVIRATYARNVRTTGFDWRCSLFQTFGDAIVEQSGDVVTLY